MVLATFQDRNGAGAIEEVTYRLKCHPLGSRLACDPLPKRGFADPFNIQVIDPDHSGGGITGSLRYQCQASDGSAKGCYRPLVWRLDQPVWLGNANQLVLKLHLEIANLDDGRIVELRGTPQEAITQAPCYSHEGGETCGVDLMVPETQFPNITDQMVLRFVDPASHYSPTATLGFLRTNSQPLVTGINSNQTLMAGQNLRFATLLVGDSATSIPLSCDPNGLQCIILPKIDPQTKKPIDPYGKAQGFLLFKDDSLVLEALQIKAGVVTPIVHTAPPPTAGAGTAAGAQPNAQVSITIQNQLQQQSLPKMFVAQ